MGRRVFLSPAAVRDLQHIRDWYTQAGAGSRAKATVTRILRGIRDLARTPFLWPLRGGSDGTRQAVVAGHVILYRVSGDQAAPAGDVEVVRIRGPGQDHPEVPRPERGHE